MNWFERWARRRALRKAVSYGLLRQDHLRAYYQEMEKLFREDNKHSLIYCIVFDLLIGVGIEDMDSDALKRGLCVEVDRCSK